LLFVTFLLDVITYLHPTHRENSGSTKTFFSAMIFSKEFIKESENKLLRKLDVDYRKCFVH